VETAKLTVPLADRISLKEKIGYSFGDAASNLYWKTFEWYLMFFYTDVFGISALAVGTMLMVTRLADAVADPVMGSIADRTHTRWGHFRPYLIWGAIPFALAGVFTFTTPNLGGGGKLIYAYITYSLLMFIYTFVNIPYSALMGVISSNSLERTSISSIRFIGAFTAGTFIQFFTLKFVKWFGQGNEARGWQLTMVFYGVLAIILLVLCFLTTRERVKPPATQKSDLGRDMQNLFTSTPWIMLVGVLLLVLAAFAVKGAASTYYFKYYLHNESLVGLFMVVNGFAFIAAVFITTRLTKIFGKKPLFIFAIGGGGLVIGGFCLPGTNSAYDVAATHIISSIISGVNALGGMVHHGFYWSISPEIFFIFALQIISSFIIGFNSPLVWAMFADTADHAEWRTGRRNTGLFFASAIFATKVGFAVGAWIFGLLLTFFGYVANVEQSARSMHGIILTMSWIPCGLMLAAAALMLLYPLSDTKMVKIEADLKARRGEAAG
jgi:GPH family glycoside/pentoside/hexuronide:cation symporter